MLLGIREWERPAFTTGKAADEARVWGAHQLACPSGRACGEGCPRLASDEPEPQQMSLDIHFVGLNSFLVLSSNWRRGESATSHHGHMGRVGGKMTHPHPIWPARAPS